MLVEGEVDREHAYEGFWIVMCRGERGEGFGVWWLYKGEVSSL